MEVLKYRLHITDPSLNHIGVRSRIICWPFLKQDEATFTHKKIVNIHIAYDKFMIIYTWS